MDSEGDRNRTVTCFQADRPQPEAAVAPLGEPCPTEPAENGTIVVCACGQANLAGTNQCVRPGCRKTLPRNALSRRTELYALHRSPEARAFEQAGSALSAQSIADAGGAAELSARELSDHEYRGVLHVRILKLAHALKVQGEFDRRGRLRKGWIELLDRLISSAVAIDKTLGLTRRAKPLPNARDILAALASEREGER